MANDDRTLWLTKVPRPMPGNVIRFVDDNGVVHVGTVESRRKAQLIVEIGGQSYRLPADRVTGILRSSIRRRGR